jgi:glycosyltransferase domain-containing protein
MQSRLTIVLPLKGRHLFTLRFLWHANKARLPYRFLIADGQVNPKLAEILDRPKQIFPQLDIEYLRYPDDTDFAHFFAKMSDALDHVRTPYAMVVDNDDFLAATGIERSIAFLDGHSDYVCCGGGLAGFSVYSGLHDSNNGLVGRLNHYDYRYTIHDHSVDFGSSSAVERLRAGSRNWWTYYAVYRTDALRTICREIVEINFSDLQLHELFCAMRTLTLGKARSEASTIAYLRQYATSQGSSFSKDWVHHLLRSNFTGDFSNMIERIASAAAAADRVDPRPVAEMLRGICEGWLREFLRVYYGSLQSVKQALREHTPRLMNWLKKRRRYFVGRERSALFANLARDGGSNLYLATFNSELETIENVLVGEEFATFIEPYMPILGAADALIEPTPLQIKAAAE